MLLRAKKGITAIDSDGIVMKNVQVIAEQGPALTIFNSKNIDIAGFTYNQGKEPVVKVLGPKTANIKLDKKDFKDAANQVSKGKDLNSTALNLE
jgi:hypothetical protein